MIFFITESQILVHAWLRNVSYQQSHEIQSISDWTHNISDKETVPKRVKSFAFSRKFIRCRDYSLQRQFQILVPITEYLLIYGSQQCILYGWARLPDFIQKYDIGSRQIAINHSFIRISVLQLTDGDWTEYLIRCAETAHQVLKATGIAEGHFQPPRHHTFSYAGHSQQKNALTGERRKQAEANYLVPFISPGTHCIQEAYNSIFNLFCHCIFFLSVFLAIQTCNPEPVPDSSGSS